MYWQSAIPFAVRLSRWIVEYKYMEFSMFVILSLEFSLLSNYLMAYLSWYRSRTHTLLLTSCYSYCILSFYCYSSIIIVFVIVLHSFDGARFLTSIRLRFEFCFCSVMSAFAVPFDTCTAHEACGWCWMWYFTKNRDLLFSKVSHGWHNVNGI